MPEDQQLIEAQIAEVRAHLRALEERRREVDAELARTAAQQQQYALVEEICTSLGQLEELGGSHLFWGEAHAEDAQAQRVAAAREAIGAFRAEIAGVEQARAKLQAEIERELDSVADLEDELAQLREREEYRKYEYVIEREYVPPPYRDMVMPWSKGEDEQRFRKMLLSVLLLAFGITYLMSFWTVPPRSPEVVEIPERLARLVKKDPPKPPEVREERPVEEPKKEEVAEQPKETPTAPERERARKKAESAGLMAFQSSFSELREMPQASLGADARITDAGQQTSGELAQRNLIVAQSQGGSGGINTARLSRNVGGAGGQGAAVEFARVESSVGTEFQESDRPLSRGVGPSRTDEEIQIIFDRYKAALYRIYNRELRSDPTLRGKMVLRITIEPDGSISALKVESTDLASKALVDEVLDRVARFNFGEKAGVPTVTILYPIDFLPAS